MWIFFVRLPAFKVKAAPVAPVAPVLQCYHCLWYGAGLVLGSDYVSPLVTSSSHSLLQVYLSFSTLLLVVHRPSWSETPLHRPPPWSVHGPRTIDVVRQASVIRSTGHQQERVPSSFSKLGPGLSGLSQWLWLVRPRGAGCQIWR